MFAEKESQIIEELIKPRVVIRSQFQPDHDLPVTHLDWGATSRPLEYVEEKVKEVLWDHYGNPHSCGTITATLTKKIIDGCKTKVLSTLLQKGALEEKYLTEFGGDGSTYWLEKIPRWFSKSTHSPVCIQRELHNSLIEPWIEEGWSVSSPPNIERPWEWFSRRLRYIREVEKKTPVLLLSASSHITGGVLNMNTLRNFVEGGDVVVLDATCYLTHHQTVPPIPFDFLVFSGHKLPGGPGSPGCILFHKKYSPNVIRKRGTENVPGIVRLTEALCLNVHLLRRHPQPRSLKMMTDIFRKIKAGSCDLFPAFWDPGDIYEEEREPVFSFMVLFNGKMIHPDIIADLLLHLFGFQIRVGGLCSDYSIPGEDILRINPAEWSETSGMETILHPSVCRVSIPRYLLNETLVMQIDGAFQEILTYGQHLVQIYNPGLEGWELHPDVPNHLDSLHGTEVVEQGCGGCPGKRGKTYMGNSEENPDLGQRKTMEVTKLIPRLLTLNLRHTLEDKMYSHPYRWFLHPLDPITIDGGGDDLY